MDTANILVALGLILLLATKWTIYPATSDKRY